MAGNAVIGALRVVLGADTASLEKGLKDSQSAIADWSKKVTAIAAGIGLEKGISKAVDALYRAVGNGIELADKFNKLSQSIGMPVEELSKLNYTAGLADVSTESLGKAVTRLSKNMVDVAGGAVGPAAQAFSAMGIAVKNTDGSLKSSSDVIAEVADKFASYRDGAAKTALAVALFGKAGAEMIPLLNAGADGLKEGGDEAQRFGLVLSKETTQAAEEFNDNLTRISKIQDGIVLQVTARLLPSLQRLAEQFVEVAKDGSTMDTIASAIENTFKGVASIALQVSTVFSRLFAEIGAFVTAFQGADGTFSGIVAGWRAMQAEGVKTEQVMSDLKGKVAAIWSNTPETPSWDSQIDGLTRMSKATEEAAKVWTQSAAPIIQSATGAKNAIDQYLASQAKRIAQQEAETATIGKSVGEQAKLRIELEAQALAKAKNIPLSDALNARIAATGDAAALAAMKLQGAQLTQQVMSPSEAFEQKMAQQKALLDANVISLDTYGKAQQMIAEQASATWDLAGASMAGSFAQIAGAFGKESKGMATAAKVFGIIQGTISMFTGAAKALELPFPANIAAVAAVLAKGASLVASIKSQTIPSGFMTGGSMMVRGSGGPDSVPVSMMASPGEQIDIWRPEQGGGRDPRRGGGGTFNVAVPNIPIGREALRSLFEQINDMAGDGYQLKMVTA